MKLTQGIACAALLATTAVCFGNDSLTPAKLVADVKTEHLQNTLQLLNQIADQNGGNRAFGQPGYKASVDFVLERAQTRFGNKFDTYLQPFNHTYWELINISVTGPDGENVTVVSPVFNPDTPLPDGITASLLNTPVNDTTGSMCLAEQWDGIDATGKLVLVKRGVCAVADRLRFAKAKGALGVILYNQASGTILVPTLGDDSIGQVIPVGIVPLEVGSAWVQRLEAGEDLQVTLIVDTVTDTKESWNVISQTKQGDPDKVVMLGAHLDSVPAGPGINDDGSGTAALLEIMESVAKYDGYPHAIRFAWWGAEEVGLVGSLFYTRGLASAEADKIRYYFNYDMIGSPNPKFEISKYGNSGIGPQLLEEFLVAAGKEVTFAEFDNRSDYAGFVELGIPTAGLFTGDGEPFDPCYHMACDDINNINWEAFTTNTKAAANALGVLANSLEGVPPRADTTPNLRARSKMLHNFRRWQVLADEAGNAETCSHGKKKPVA